MPLLVISAAEAFERVRASRSRWPGRNAAQAHRLTPLARPDFDPSFRFGKADPVFAIGSCFARNIEKQLMIEGYNVAFPKFRPPLDPGFKADPDAMLHRYLVQSIANELAWAVGDGPAFPDAFYFEQPGGWYDLQLHVGASAAPLDLVKSRRKAILDYMALAAQAKVFIMTLGLAEAWYDTETGYYLNAAPPTYARKFFKDRFEFHLLAYEEILQGLERVHELLTRYGRPELKILVTVSPVALSSTFTGGDVMTATVYMKSALRTAVEAFVRGHDNVDYFPSYESVTLSDRRRAWREDQAHVSDEVVRLNVLRMLQAYSQEPGNVGEALAALSAYDHIHKAREAVAWDLHDKALECYRAAAAAAPEDPVITLEVGRFLLNQRRWDEALPVIEASLKGGSELYGGEFCLAKALYELKRYREAHEAGRRAREHQPNHPSVVNLCANIAVKLGLQDEALELSEQHLQMEPESESSRARLEKLKKKPGLLGGLIPRAGKPLEAAD